MRQSLMLLSASVAVAAVVATLVTPADADTRSFDLSGFSRIDVSAGVTAIVRQGPAFAVQVDEPKGEFDRLIVERHGDTLRLSRKSGWGWFGYQPRYTVTVTAPAYTGFNVSSGAALEGGSLSMQAVRLDVSSGAQATMSGLCTDLSASISSGARFDGLELRCESARVNASSGASADAFATRAADGNASSGARIVFHGQPATLEKSSSSGGSVRAL